MQYIKHLIIFLSFTCSILSAAEFTISSYNCGGLSDHYDYLRAASMQKLMQERHTAEPEKMSQNERIQQLALKILFSSDPQEKILAQNEWDQKNYQTLSKQLTALPKEPNSPNKSWNEKAEQMISSYNVRPVSLYDQEVEKTVINHLRTLSEDKTGSLPQLLNEGRSAMANRIFSRDMKFDIVCLQEANYLNRAMFPEKYQVSFADTSHLINGIAWNKDRFELVDAIGDLSGKAFAIELIDKETSKTILVASGHLSGCNPFRQEINQTTGAPDSAKGDAELQMIIDLFKERQADLMLIGMDSNVTSLHPRLQILKDAGYQIDDDHFIEPTCTNPYQVLNTRIDWIALKAETAGVSITNIPVAHVGLNSIETNVSDHKPIAAKISY